MSTMTTLTAGWVLFFGLVLGGFGVQNNPSAAVEAYSPSGIHSVHSR